MKKVWFTADTHFDHRRIPLYAKRKFCLDQEELDRLDESPPSTRNTWAPSWSSVARMNDHIIEQINSRVDQDDILWHLGDFCWGRKGELLASARKFRDRIRCRNVFLVMGNHDSDEIGSAFDACHRYKEIKVGSLNIVLSHYAHCFWNRSHYGSWMLYGHAHGTAEEWLDSHMPGRQSMDVGVDNVARLTGEYRPISSEEIAVLFSSKKGCQIDGHKPKPQALRGPESCYNHDGCQKTDQSNAR
jgi:calcineurin-like phosphoesterase family protein